MDGWEQIKTPLFYMPNDLSKGLLKSRAKRRFLKVPVSD